MAKLRYRITHTTAYSYEVPVRVCHNLVMLTPRSDWVVRPFSHRVTVKPHPAMLNLREDYFGNQIHAFSIEESHRQLTVNANSQVEVHYSELPPVENTPTWEEVRDEVVSQEDPRWLEACQFRFRSPRVEPSNDFADYAMKSFRGNRPILDAALDLTHRIHAQFHYDSTATDVHTRTEEAFHLKRGVCQDFAHVQIACLRSIGLCARYVSGYLRTCPPQGQPRLVGADQSHAWLSLYCGHSLGWVDLDPTNNKLCNVDHIPIAWGRDYNDVVPVRGVFLGGGRHSIHVSVDVNPTSDN